MMAYSNWLQPYIFNDGSPLKNWNIHQNEYSELVEYHNYQRHNETKIMVLVRTLILGILSSFSLVSLAEPSHNLDTMVVTLERTDGSEFDAPISSIVLTEEDLHFSEYRDIGDLQNTVPNLRSIPHPNSSSTLLLFIRGIGNIDEQIIQDPSVAVHTDGVYWPRSQGLNNEMLDIERVEVSRGPQGTLYGRNATGGAINIITRPPNTLQSSFSQQVDFGQHSSLRTLTQANLALHDNFAFTASYLDSQSDGFVDNEGLGASRFGDRDRNGFRIDNLWTPHSDLQLRLIVDSANSTDTPTYVGPVHSDSKIESRPNTGNSGSYSIRDNLIETSGQAFIIDWDVSNALSLKSITAFRQLDDFQNQKFINWVSQAEGEQQQKSQELQLFANSNDGFLNATMGLFWFNEEAKREARNIVSESTARRIFARDIENTSKAVYLQFNWLPPVFSRNLELRLGGRQSWDERFVFLDRASEDLDSGILKFRPQPDIGDSAFKNFSPSFGLSYYASDNLHLYFNQNHGYKSGGFNARATSPDRFRQGFDDETLVSNEIGIKSLFFDDKLDLNLAYFYSDYRDIQLNIQSDPLDPSLSDVLNAGEAKVKGIEFQGNVLLSDMLSLGFNYAYLSTQYDEIIDASGQNVADQYQFVGAPKHTFQLSIAGALLKSLEHQLNYKLNFSWQDDYFTIKSANASQFTVPSYALFSGHIEWLKPVKKGYMSVALWGRNLLDVDYYTNRFNGAIGKVVPSATWGEGRTIGLSFKYEL